MMYRILLLDNDQIEIQAQADLTNDTAEDWKQIKMKLVANDLQIVKKTNNKNVVIQSNNNQRMPQRRMMNKVAQQRMIQNQNDDESSEEQGA